MTPPEYWELARLRSKRASMAEQNRPGRVSKVEAEDMKAKLRAMGKDV